MTKDFQAGAESFRDAALTLITQQSSTWVQSGPSKATADAIAKWLRSLPVPAQRGGAS